MKRDAFHPFHPMPGTAIRRTCPLLLATALLGAAPARAEQPAAAPAAVPAPTFAELGEVTYGGIAPEPLAFAGGRWQGPPAGPGQPPAVARLLDAPFATGDFDGDGLADAAAVVATNGSSAGSYRHLVIVVRRDDGLENLAAVALGDGLEVTALHFDERDLVVDFLAPPENEGQESRARTRRFVYSGLQVREIAPLTAFGDIYWHLAAIDGHSMALSRIPRTLGHGPGLLAGNSGCNAFRAPVTEEGGRIHVSGPIDSMKRACASGVMAIERSYLKMLTAAERLEYAGEELELVYRDPRGERRLRFSRVAPKPILPKRAGPPPARRTGPGQNTPTSPSQIPPPGPSTPPPAVP